MKALLLIFFAVLVSTEYVQGAALKKIVGEWFKETLSKILNHFFQGGVSNMLNHAINESVGEMIDSQRKLNPESKEEKGKGAKPDNSDFLSGLMAKTQKQLGDQLSNTANNLLKDLLKTDEKENGVSKTTAGTPPAYSDTGSDFLKGLLTHGDDEDDED
ncbi:unnamed protein product [Trichobilharzia szidati]|nr:unnamed protein product [Trichobilharzia szidati]